MNRRLVRIRAVQALYQVDLTEEDPVLAIEAALEEEEEGDDFLTKLVEGTVNHLDEVDECIKEHLTNWSLDRIGNVDRAILRLATYEMLYEQEIPMNASLNEAIDLAKGFNGEESGRFVNGVLSSVSKSITTKDQ
ncbi:transcription antitermination factor NusB [Texcoconibacillus texcoconensis]|uniref:Transcription antitermination protein NusB n=1 Tax=Texcoconibacillus texcoconensis TaxID=1095777 RepID=A0A840QNY0_9BACI|nr:transcription antitermination factor NusB [Texcoconibacillus texcoconensis]MBB5173070.1 N utilization substance protein B [Texcoconibacillus texcoconensis]